MGERRVEIVRGVYEGLRARRRTGRARSVVRRVRVVRGRSYGGLYRTREAVTEKLFGPLIEDIPLRGIAGEFIGSEDTVVAVVRYTGSGKATGKRLDLSVVHVWDIRDDKIARFRHFVDTVKFLEVMP